VTKRVAGAAATLHLWQEGRLFIVELPPARSATTLLATPVRRWYPVGSPSGCEQMPNPHCPHSLGGQARSGTDSLIGPRIAEIISRQILGGRIPAVCVLGSLWILGVSQHFAGC
jgi:hypothetical protein